MGVEIRSIAEDEVPAFRTVVGRAFGGDPKNDDESIQRFLDQVELDRTYAGFDGGSVVGTAATFSFDMAVPGKMTTPMGGLTMVSVIPTHRRRGLLNRLMQAHFDDCRGRGEAVAGLWASESSIYGRYGFGDACPFLEISYDQAKVGVPQGPDETRIVSVDEAAKVMKEIYPKVMPTRPGMLSRSDSWWQHRHLRDPEEWRDGATERRYVAAYRGGEPVGYTSYRQKSKWDDGLPLGKVTVGEVVAVDRDAELSLWSLVSSVDLFPNVESWFVPLDWQIPHQVANPRAIKRVHGDGQYVRVLDVAAALGDRRYQSSGTVTISVEDPLGFTGGTFRLEASDAGHQVEAFTGEAEVSMDITTLSTLYLGAPGAGALARAGKIRGDGDAIRRFGQLLVNDPAPWCPEVY